jgi:hypothetical protein
LCRNCLLQQVIEGKIKGGIEVTGRRGRRRRKLLDGLKKTRGYSHLKEEVLDCTIWTAGFGRSFGPVVRQTAEWMDEFTLVWKVRAWIYTLMHQTFRPLSLYHPSISCLTYINLILKFWPTE